MANLIEILIRMAGADRRNNVYVIQFLQFFKFVCVSVNISSNELDLPSLLLIQ